MTSIRDIEKDRVVIACVVRDVSGMLIDFFGKKVNASLAMVAMALTNREAAIFCLKVGFSRLANVSDSAQLTRWLIL